MKNIPGTPIHWLSKGPPMSETAKAMPMVAPMVAIALVRCSSRVKSANKAVTTAETAPAP